MRRTLRARICLCVLFTLPAAALGSGTAGAAADPDASATPDPDPGVSATAQQYSLHSALGRALGDRTAGSYLDAESGALVVTVTDEAAADDVRAAGARAEIVGRSTAQLESAIATLDTQAKIAGTSWGIDPAANQVSVEADQSVSARSMARLEKVAARLGEAVRIQRVPGVFTKEVAGGDAIYGGGSRCSTAFNVSKGTVRYFVTAGHCTTLSSSWSAVSGGPSIGTREGTSFPTNDYGIVRYTGTTAPAGNVNLYNGNYQDITSAADAIVGQAIRKSGSTTKVTHGTVTAVNVTVNYGDGPVYNMVRTTACSAGGDSGGAHFAGSTALGIHSGSSGCSGTNGSAIHQPVREALSAYGVNVY
ncbi:S1 family peptidase [Streptomyces sp. NBC_01142]|uniref:S1 family peptidase n=1 Tax=Streptomyces sp. NBC_01142 TaxID=2975865 RepID=UPI002257575F|nr:S1 family peptidase [Streptomyces sp. NBC_01142]MCX4820660.1 S1 family peptidase [Streptomyces sp. NBC_01142]